MTDDISPRPIFSSRRLVPLGLLAAAWIAFMLAGGNRYLSFAVLAENRDWLCSLVQQWGLLAAFGYIAIYGALVALSVPGAAVLTITGGFLFGTWLGALYAARSVAFAIPNAVGVQEGAYILLGVGFGLTPETALALSLLKRARDLTIGLPVLAAWQLVESGRLWRRVAAPSRARRQ